MNIILKKTSEFDNTTISELCALFERVFEKEMTLVDFDKKFKSNTFQTSYHALLLSDAGDLCGCYSSIPQQYSFFGKDVVFGLSVDTMIDEAYRGNPFTLKKMANEVYKSMKNNGISFVFGFPNDNVYLVRKKILKWKDIGKLDFYILPIKIGAIKPSLRPLNIVSKLFSWIMNSFVGYETIEKYSVYPIEKKNYQGFRKSRYDKSYEVIDFDDDAYFSYKIYNEDDVKTAYIIDVYPLNKTNLQKAVKMVYKSDKDIIDLIMYVGNLNFNVVNLIKVPKKYQPKNVFMSGKILDSSVVDERVYDLSNWNVNLSNYDVR